jgi:hypothetical protein
MSNKKLYCGCGGRVSTLQSRKYSGIDIECENCGLVIENFPTKAEAIEAFKTATGIQWISVEDRLPDTGRSVLICWQTKIEKLQRVSRGWYAHKHSILDEGDYYEQADYSEEKDDYYFPEGFWEVPWEAEAAYPLSNITHWAEIQLPNKE